jgi:acetyl esterase/lipase
MKAACLALLACLIASLALAAPASDAAFVSGGTFDVEVVKDIAYYTGVDADPVKHKLDLYLPKGKKGFPVLFFVHGGGWKSGDKNYFLDVYGNIGRTLAKNGVGAVVTNYRLSPKVQHPAHVQDVAKAFAWTYHNIAKHGGNRDEIVVCGHSAGGHLVSLLALDPKYLEAEKLSPKFIRAAAPLSGVYAIPGGKLFASVFGDDAEMRKLASPQHHVKGNHPPFLIVYADGDFPTCDKMSEDLCTALKGCKCDAKTCVIKERNHFTIIMQAANDTDPSMQELLRFIAMHTSLKLQPKAASK